MNPQRLQDARRLLGQISAAEWVDLYGRDLLDHAQRAEPDVKSRGAVATIAAAGGVLGHTCADAIRSFERAFGGGSQDAGRRLLSQNPGKLKLTPIRMAAALVLYTTIRRGVLAWGAAFPQEARPAPGTGAAPAPERSRRLKTALAMALDEAEGQPFPETATAEDRDRIREGFRRLRDTLHKMGLLAEAPNVPEPSTGDGGGDKVH